MKRKTNQSGFGSAGLLFVLVVIAVVVVAGYLVWKRDNTTGTANVPVISTNSSAGSVPTKITSKADLSQASSALDANNLNSLDGNGLNSDINSLL